MALLEMNQHDLATRAAQRRITMTTIVGANIAKHTHLEIY